MVHPAVRRRRHAGARPVAGAVVGVAEEGAPLLHVRVARVGVPRVRRPLGPARVDDHGALPARADALLVEVRLELVAGPLPDVPPEVVQPEGVGGIAPHRGRDVVPVGEGVLEGEAALPDVRPVDALRHELRAPDVALAVGARPRRPLPLGLRGQALARPLGVGRRVEPRHVDHGVGVHALDGAAGPQRVAPVRARGPRPPLGVVAQVHGPGGLAEDEGARHERAGGRLGRPRGELRRELLPGGHELRGRAVARRLHEARELPVGDLGLVHPEAVDPHPVSRPLVGPAFLPVPAHGERAGLDPDHPRGGLGARRPRLGGLLGRRSCEGEQGEEQHRAQCKAQRKGLCTAQRWERGPRGAGRPA